MGRSEAEDADGRLPVKDDNKAAAHFSRRTLRFFNCGNYNQMEVVLMNTTDTKGIVTTPV